MMDRSSVGRAEPQLKRTVENFSRDGAKVEFGVGFWIGSGGFCFS